jgi:hypothetical protein
VRRPNSAGKPAARQCWGSFFRRRRWRLAALFTGECPRIAKFHNTILQLNTQNLAPQYPGARFFVLPLLAWAACPDLASPHLSGRIAPHYNNTQWLWKTLSSGLPAAIV